MNLAEVPKLLRSAWHTKPRQLGARASLTARRHLLVGARRLGVPDGPWFREPAPPWCAGAPQGRSLAHPAGAGRLPLDFNLAGTPWRVEVGMDWDPRELNHGTRLEKLHLHYMEYLHELQPSDACALMHDWAERVPPHAPDFWRDSWNCYALSIRTVTWLDILSDCPETRIGVDVGRILQSVAAQIRFLERNLEQDIGGNHLMKNIRALMRAASCFDGPEAERWLRTGRVLLGRELEEQILSDGMHFERSPSYHLQVMEDLVDIRRCLGFRRPHECHALDCCLQRMATVARSFTHPDGMPSLFADGGLHMAARLEDVLAAMRGFGLEIGHGEVHAPGPWRLAEAGYVGLTTGEEAIIFDCGPVGPEHLPAHGHGDALAIEWSVRGERFLVDAGVFEYHAGARRAYSRSTLAHNTVTLSNADQSEFWSAFRVGRRARVTVHRWEPDETGFHIEASHDGYRRLAGKPVHVRTLRAQPGKLDVTDRIDGGRGQRTRGRLLLAPGIDVSPSRALEGGRHAALLSGPRSAIRATLTSDVPIHTEPAEWNPDFGVSMQTRRIVLDMGPAPSQASWTLAID